MLRQVRRSLLHGRFIIIAAPSRPPEGFRAVGCTSYLQKRPYLERSFSQGNFRQKQPDSRFFWPSRPDFLPNKAIRSSYIDEKGRRQDEIQAIARFQPIGLAEIALPSPEGIAYPHAPLYTSIAKAEVDTAWIHFVSHLNDLANSRAAPLDSALFDCLFWLVAREDLFSRQRQEEVFGRVEILLMYTSSQAKYGLSRLQLHRTVYIWTTLWEQCDVKHKSFPYFNFTDTVISRLNDLDSRIASRVFSRLVNSCKSAEEVGTVKNRIESWLALGQSRATRQEAWASTSKMEIINDAIYFKGEESAALDSKMWDNLLQKCYQIGATSETVSAGLLALRQTQLDTSADIASRFLAFLPTGRLYNLLPKDIKNGAAAIDNSISLSLPDKISAALAAKEDEIFSEDDKRRLMYHVAFVLATRLRNSAALFLYEKDSQEIRKDHRSRKQIEMYTAAANACARLATYRTRGANPLIQDASWSLIQLKRGVRLFSDCDWHESSSRNTTVAILVEAFWSCIIHNEEKASVQSKDLWTSLLRQFTTVLLSHDPNLETMQLNKNTSTFSRLIRLHIFLQDYPFTKRIFLVWMMRINQSDSLSPIVKQDDFLWLFRQSMLMEEDVRLSSQLFLYWSCLEVKEDETYYSKTLPVNLLKLYFWKLKNSDQGRQGIKMLQENIDMQDFSGKGELLPNQAIRMMLSYFAVGKDTMHISLDLAEDLLQYWTEKREKHTHTLINLYSIAIIRSTWFIDESDVLLRLRILKLFNTFQQRIEMTSRKKRLTIGKDCRDVIRDIYAGALKALIKGDEKLPLWKLAEEIIKDMRDSWNIEVNGGRLWSLRIEARLVGCDADVDHARALYDEALRSFEKGKGKEALSAPVTSRLMMALGSRGDYKEALELMTIYKCHTGPLLSDMSNAYIEGAHIAILHMQGHSEEALYRLNSLKEAGDRQHLKRKPNASWLQIVSDASAHFEDEQIMSNQKQEEQEQESEGIEYDLPTELDEEEQERARIFRAMASGQPWKRS